MELKSLRGIRAFESLEDDKSETKKSLIFSKRIFISYKKQGTQPHPPPSPTKKILFLNQTCFYAIEVLLLR